MCLLVCVCVRVCACVRALAARCVEPREEGIENRVLYLQDATTSLASHVTHEVLVEARHAVPFILQFVL